MNERWTNYEAKWLWIAAVWGGIAIFDGTQTVFGMRAEGMHHSWATLFVVVMATWLPWALATPVIVQLGQRFPPVRLRPLSIWLVHLSACIAIDLVSSAWNALLYHTFNPYLLSGQQSFLDMWRSKLVYGLLSSVLLYAFILIIAFMLDARERLSRQQAETARLNEQLTKAQLNALRRQIEPHFLFNTLNAIAGLIREEKNDAAVSMIAGLSDFLRRTVQDSARHEVPLAEEMDMVERYLEIQKVRFAERLQLAIDVPTELLPAQVPALILQPLVENAVKHGISKRVQGGTLRISAARQNGTLTLRVYNDGPALPQDCTSCEGGVGLANVRTRLKSLYGERFDFTMRDTAPGGVETSVSLPFRKG